MVTWFVASFTILLYSIIIQKLYSCVLVYNVYCIVYVKTGTLSRALSIAYQRWFVLSTIASEMYLPFSYQVFNFLIGMIVFMWLKYMIKKIVYIKTGIYRCFQNVICWNYDCPRLCVYVTNQIGVNYVNSSEVSLQNCTRFVFIGIVVMCVRTVVLKIKYKIYNIKLNGFRITFLFINTDCLLVKRT